MPVKGWEAYVGGVSRCITSHAAALRAVHLRFEVRTDLQTQQCLRRQTHALMSRTDFNVPMSPALRQSPVPGPACICSAITSLPKCNVLYAATTHAAAAL